MKKKKTLRHHLTRVIHPNRHFIYAIIFSLAAALLLLSYIVITSIRFDTNNNVLITSAPTRPVYTDSVLGYSVHYPAGWLLEKDDSGNTVFENPHVITESITVTSSSADNAKLIKHGLTIKQETTYTINGFEIDRMIASTAKGNGGDMDVAILIQGKKLFYVSGHSGMFDGFINSIKLTD